MAKYRKATKGSGSVFKLSGNRRKPWTFQVTVGYERGLQIRKYAGYYETRQEAEQAKAMYVLQNAGIIENLATFPTSTERNSKAKKPTFAEIWETVFEKKISKLSDSSKRVYKGSFKTLVSIHNRPIDTIKLADLQAIFDEQMKKKASKSKLDSMSIVLNYVFEYALQYDLIEKSYVKYIDFEDTRESVKTKRAFTKNEIKKLFNDDSIIAKSIIIMTYTGMRPSEMLKLKKENIHLNESYMVGGLKTRNGIDRTIPIHECIKEYIDEFVNSKFYDSVYVTYKNNFKNKCNELGIDNVSPHCGRHTFATLAEEYGLNEFLVKRIMGHTTNDLTKDVYTHASTERLIDEVNKIPTPLNL